MRSTIMLTLCLGIVLMGTAVVPASAADTTKHRYSDQWITWRIDALLQNDARFDYRKVKVATRNGVVTLKGSVLTDVERGRAEFVASDLPGVKGVVNDIETVEPLNDDMILAKQIRSEIIEDPIFNTLALSVDTKDGAVELHGIVGSFEQKRLLDKLIRETPGVKHLENEILVEP